MFGSWSQPFKNGTMVSPDHFLFKEKKIYTKVNWPRLMRPFWIRFSNGRYYSLTCNRYLWNRPFENWILKCLVFKWIQILSGIQMVQNRSVLVPTIRKLNMASLGRFTCNKKSIFIKKRPRLEQCFCVLDHSKSEQNGRHFVWISNGG